MKHDEVPVLVSEYPHPLSLYASCWNRPCLSLRDFRLAALANSKDVRASSREQEISRLVDDTNAWE